MMIPSVLRRCLGLKDSKRNVRVDCDHEMTGKAQGKPISATVTIHNGIGVKEACRPKQYANNIEEDIYSEKEETSPREHGDRGNLGPLEQPQGRISVQGDSWVLHSSGLSKRTVPQSNDTLEKRMGVRSKESITSKPKNTTTRRPSQMTQEIIKLKQQYEALQSSFKHLNHNFSPSSDTSKDDPTKNTSLRHSTPLRPMQESRPGAQSFRPRDNAAASPNCRQRSTPQSHRRHSFRNSELKRYVLIWK